MFTSVFPLSASSGATRGTGSDDVVAGAPESVRRAVEESARIAETRERLALAEQTLLQRVTAARLTAGRLRRLWASFAGYRILYKVAVVVRRAVGRSPAGEPGDARNRALYARVGALEWSMRALGQRPSALQPAAPPEHRPRRRLEAGCLSFCLRIGARDAAAAEAGGDLNIAGALARELECRGHSATIATAGGADVLAGRDYDVVVHLRGRAPLRPSTGSVDVLWLMSHPEEVSPDELDSADLVLAASARLTESLAVTTRTPVETFLQFTDPRVFRPLRDPSRTHELLFVGNWRGVFRQAPWDALTTGHEVALYGAGWRWLAPRHAVAEHVPHSELAGLYGSCKVLLNDHWPAMKETGIVSNRIFDALACGAFVISDDFPDIAEMLSGGLETYRGRDDLSNKIARALDEPERRQRVADRGREMVLAEHTVGPRVDQLLRLVEEIGG